MIDKNIFNVDLILFEIHVYTHFCINIHMHLLNYSIVNAYDIIYIKIVVALNG